MPQSRKRFRRRSGGLVSRKRRRTRSLRRFPRRTHRSSRRTFSRSIRRGRRSSRIHTGFGVTPWSRTRVGHGPRISRSSRIRAVMSMGKPIRYLIQNGGFVKNGEDVAGYSIVSMGHIADLATCAHYGSNIQYQAGVTPVLLPERPTSDFVMASMTLKIHFKNDSLGNTLLELWECTAKTFTPNSESDTFTILTNGFLDTEVANALTTPNANPLAIDPATSPFMNPRLSTFYRGKRPKKVTLLPGQRYDHTIRMARPWIVKGQRINRGAWFDYAGHTIRLLIRARGDVGYDATTTSVVYGPSLIDYTYETEYKYFWSPGWDSQEQVVYDGIIATADNVNNISAVTGANVVLATVH